MDVIHARCAGSTAQADRSGMCASDGGGALAARGADVCDNRRRLRALQEWLVAAGCTHAVMESTGAYWKACGTGSRTT